MGELKAVRSSAFRSPTSKPFVLSAGIPVVAVIAIINSLLCCWKQFSEQDRLALAWVLLCARTQRLAPYQVLRCAQQFSCYCDLILPQWPRFLFPCDSIFFEQSQLSVLQLLCRGWKPASWQPRLWSRARQCCKLTASHPRLGDQAKRLLM